MIKTNKANKTTKTTKVIKAILTTGIVIPYIIAMALPLVISKVISKRRLRRDD